MSSQAHAWRPNLIDLQVWTRDGGIGRDSGHTIPQDNHYQDSHNTQQNAGCLMHHQSQEKKQNFNMTAEGFLYVAWNSRLKGARRGRGILVRCLLSPRNKKLQQRQIRHCRSTLVTLGGTGRQITTSFGPF